MHWKADRNLYPAYLRTRIQRRRGVGLGAAYLPWLKVRDVPSRGTSSIIPGIAVSRPHHLLSELEAIYFYLSERKSSTVDIREQWPILDIDRTLELCEEFDVQHKYRGPFPEPFTIDFLITEQTDHGLSHRAASVKTAEDAKNPRIRQRLAVEREWCRERGIRWTLVDTTEFDKTLLSNLRFLRAWFLHGFEVDPRQATRFADCFNALYETNVALTSLIRRAGRALHMPEQMAEDFFRYCGWDNLIAVSLGHRLALNQPLVLRRKAAYE